MSYRVELKISEENDEIISFLKDLKRYRSKVVTYILNEAYKNYGSTIRQNPKAFLELYGESGLPVIKTAYEKDHQSQPDVKKKKEPDRTKSRVKKIESSESKTVIGKKESSLPAEKESLQNTTQDNTDEIIGGAGLLVDADD